MKYRNKLTRHFNRATAIRRTLDADILREFDNPPKRAPESRVVNVKGWDGIRHSPCTIAVTIPVTRGVMDDVRAAAIPIGRMMNPNRKLRHGAILLWKGGRRMERQKGKR